MTARWSAGGDVGLDVLERVQRSLTVDMIMTPRGRLMTCRSEDTIAAAMRKNSMDYSFLPVVDGSDRYLGLFDAGHWFRRTPTEEPIGENFEPFSEDLVIGADASIFEFVMQADERPTRLVVSGQKVAGLISISDLQQLPVRAALFTLITGLEIAMAKRIEAEWPHNGDAWKGLLSDPRRADLEGKISEARKSDNFVSEIALTQLCDKSTVICKAKLIPGGRRKLEAALGRIERLRNSLAHANYYAETPETAKKVCSVVRSILEIKTELLKGTEQKQQEKEAAA